VAEGEHIAITGPSGSGKSTLLHVLGLLDVPTTGRYLLAGSETSGLCDRDRTSVRGQLIGFVFQSFHLLANRSVTDNVMLSSLYRGSDHRHRRADALSALDRVGLAHRADAHPSTLSGGERQRVAIARAIANRPRLLLCDEPTGNLDTHSTAGVLDLIDELNVAGVTILVITHNVAVASRAGRQLVITDGVVTEVGIG
jgi:putative ABC transport system ATP-binding protein